MRRIQSNQDQQAHRAVERPLRDTIPFVVNFTQNLLLSPQLRSTLERNITISIVSPMAEATFLLSMKNPSALMSLALLALMGHPALVLEMTTSGRAVLQVPAALVEGYVRNNSADVSRLLSALGVMPRPQAELITERSDVQAGPEQHGM